jgi:hypothetical protein
MVNSEDIIGTTDRSDVIAGLSHKPMSLYPGSVVHRVYPYMLNI